MPVQLRKDKKGCFAQWGNGGTKYYYSCGNNEEMKKAKEKAERQGQAIKAGQNE